jgi:hypothetical protein
MNQPKKPAHSKSEPHHHHPKVEPHQRPDGGDAFFSDPSDGAAHAPDDLAEELAEDFLSSATSGEEQGEETHEEEVEEELGGPFVESTAGEEFASGTDASNPRSAERAPFPTTSRTPPRK